MTFQEMDHTFLSDCSSLMYIFILRKNIILIVIILILYLILIKFNLIILNIFEFNILFFILFKYYIDKNGDGDWGLGIGDWGLGIGPNPQSPIPDIVKFY